MEVAKCSLPPDDSGTQAKEGMKEREGDKKKRGREAGGKQGKAKSRIKKSNTSLGLGRIGNGCGGASQLPVKK